MKLLVSNSTNTLVPTNASGASPSRAAHPLVRFQQRPRGAVSLTATGGFRAFRERGDLLQDAVFEDPEIGRLQTVDVVALVVGHLEAQHHHVDLDAEDGPLSILGAQHGRRAGSHSEESSSRNRHESCPGSSFCIAVLPSARPLRCSCALRATSSPTPRSDFSSAGQSSRCEAKICSTSLLRPLRNAHVQLRGRHAAVHPPAPPSRACSIPSSPP